MDGNPFARMLAVMREEGGESAAGGETRAAGLGAAACKLRLGKVTQRKPLKINVMGVEQPTQVLRINERLTDGAKWKVTIKSPDSDYNDLDGQLEGPVECPGGHGSPQLGAVTGGQLHSGDTVIGKDAEGSMATTEQLEIDLEVGDRVLLLTEDDQIFYIVMKVVDAV